MAARQSIFPESGNKEIGFFEKTIVFLQENVNTAANIYMIKQLILGWGKIANGVN